MTNDPLAVPAKHLRATDTNSLLRLYDRLNDLCRRALSRLDRARATKALERIVLELHKRQVPVGGSPA